MRKYLLLSVTILLLTLASMPHPTALLAFVWSDDIEGYASAESINIGESIAFHVSTTASSYHIDIYRIGWYGDMGGQWIFGVKDLPGTNYGYPAPDATTGLIEADWPTAYTLNTDSSWETGYYVARLTPSTGEAGNIVFIIRDDASTADILYVPPFTTYQAYNAWGGKSIYEFNSSGVNAYGDARAYKISFNRPYDDRNGLKYLFDGDFQMIRWLEREGYDVAYASSVDLHSNPNLLDNHSVFLSNYHDEYYSWEMRENVTNARDAGVDLAYFTSNNIYWQMRYESSPLTGAPNRVITCYKSETSGQPFSTLDPYATSADPDEVKRTTVQWRQSPVDFPENELLGVMYEGHFDDTIHYDWIVQNSTHWIYTGTGLTDGAAIPVVIGDEYDHYFGDGGEPAGVTVLSNSPIAVTSGTQNGSIYQAASGAYVFDGSTNRWALKLMDTQYDTGIAADANMEIMTRNLLNTMIGEPQPTSWSGEAYIFDDGLTFEWEDNNSAADFWEEGTIQTGTRSLRVDMTDAGSHRLSLTDKTTFDATAFTYFQLSVQPTVADQSLSAFFWYNGSTETTHVPLHSYTGSPGYPTVGSWTIYCVPLTEFGVVPDDVSYFWLRGASGSYATVYVDNIKFTHSADDCDPNTTPTTTGIGDVIVNEDGSDTIIDLTLSFADVEDASADLVYTVTANTNTGLVTATADNSTDTLSLSYVSDGHGSTSIMVQATDSGGKSVDTTFQVTVNPVNDPPSFTSLGDQSVPFGTNSIQSVAGWAYSFDFGPADEDLSQTVLDFPVSVTAGAALFTVLPDVDNTGTLTYTPTGTAGTATIEIQLQDNGGTANGGTDLSDVTILHITINANTDPTTTGIADVTVNQNAPDSIIDLTLSFADAEDAAADLVYAVTTNTNTGLVSTSVDNSVDTLTLSYTADDYGSTNITVQATDSGGLTVDTTFLVTVNPIVAASVTEQELQLRLNSEITTNPDIQTIDFAVVDLVPGGFDLTLRLVDGTVGNVSVSVVDNGYATLQITSMSVDGAAAPGRYVDAITRELMPLIVSSLDSLFAEKVGAGRNLESLSIAGTLIAALFSQ